MKYIVCYSGGHSSAIAAIECVRRFGKDNVILLNHDITGQTQGIQIEHKDIKRFKQQVADYLELEITYANSDKYTTPLEVIQDKGIIHNTALHTAVCTYYLKTQPFYNWLEKHYPASHDKPNNNVRLVYGFDKNEKSRIQNKVSTAFKQGYTIECPCAWDDKDRTIYNTKEIGIEKPSVYDRRKHANCIGCHKAGLQSWYVTYVTSRPVFDAHAAYEESSNYTILPQGKLNDLRELFSFMHTHNVRPNENIKFYWNVYKHELQKQKHNYSMFDTLDFDNDTNLPCDCFV